VLLECGHALACDFTSRLISIPLPAKVDDDVRDSIGELANMLGGNFKALLPRGTSLSTPSVVDGSDYHLRICGGGHAVVERVAYRSPAGIFWITLVEMPRA
jgi:CheY-specific phosphatase CheX